MIDLKLPDYEILDLQVLSVVARYISVRIPNAVDWEINLTALMKMRTKEDIDFVFDVIDNKIDAAERHATDRGYTLEDVTYYEMTDDGMHINMEKMIYE